MKGERGGYYLRREAAKDHPEEYISIIIDGADFFNYAVPYFCVKTHDKLFRVPVYVIGVIVHGIMTKCYIVPSKFKQGTNVIMDVLMRVLQDLKDAGHKIPKKLYIQLDNTCKQNKSRFMMGFLAHFILTGVFERILVSFLPVGHTHEDIDQLFSRLVTALRNRDARTLSELCTIIKSAYKDKSGNHTQTEVVESVANFSDWIKELINEFDGISQFRQFLFKWNQDKSKVLLRVRTDTTSADWQGIKQFSDFTDVYHTIPPRYCLLHTQHTHNRQ